MRQVQRWVHLALADRSLREVELLANLADARVGLREHDRLAHRRRDDLLRLSDLVRVAAVATSVVQSLDKLGDRGDNAGVDGVIVGLRFLGGVEAIGLASVHAGV